MPDPSNPQAETAAPTAQEDGDALPVGVRLAEFEIREVIGAGGFGIVYRAWDHALERDVALKEYMPVSLAGRGSGERVTLRSRGHEENFALGLRSFVNEARLLARFDQPALVKVYRFWEANGTAYMAMPLYRGRTLRQLRSEMGERAPDEAWLRALIDPLLGALAVMHGADVYHRDIAPDNILWCDDGRPVLLDFGAARHVLADRTQNVTAILKPQFAPIEQYADTQSMRQGPWTDLYALASTCYFMLTGRPPLAATARVMGDELVPLARQALPGCSSLLLEVLDWAMAVRPQDRPQSVAAFRDALAGKLAVPEPWPATVRMTPPTPAAPAAPAAFEKTVQATTRQPASQEAPGPRARDPQPLNPPSPAKARPMRALVLGLAAATVFGLAWTAQWYRGQGAGAGPQPAGGAASSVAAPASPMPPASTLQAVAEAASVPASSVATAIALGASSVDAGSTAAASAPASSPTSAAASDTTPQGHAKQAPHASRLKPVTPKETQQAPAAVPVAPEPVPSRESVDPAAGDKSAKPAAAAASAARGPGPREICMDLEPTKVGACVKRLCDNEPRFQHYPACVRVRLLEERQAQQRNPE
jgi:serine/threonine protein kinase